MWKAKYLTDTDEEPELSSEDEATGMAPHQAVARHLPTAWGDVPLQSPESWPILMPRVPTATGAYWSPVLFNWSPVSYFSVILMLTVQSPVLVSDQSPVTYFNVILVLTVWLPVLVRNNIVLFSVVATLVGMSIESGLLLEPHQVVVDLQELRRLH